MSSTKLGVPKRCHEDMYMIRQYSPVMHHLTLFLYCFLNSSNLLYSQTPVLVKDINMGINGSYGGAYRPTVSNGVSYFWADEGVHGYELWRSDGTADGTFLIKDINPGRDNSYNGVNSEESRYYSGVTVINEILYFSADDGVHGYELWRSDGTADGTFLVKDINPGDKSGHGDHTGYTRGVAVLNGILYFGANDGVHGMELWRSDGTADGTFLVKDINPPEPYGYSSNGYGYAGITVVDGILYFSADDSPYKGKHGYELWRSDGTADGTFLVKDINPGIGNGYGFGVGVTVVNGIFYFSADDGVHGYELWRSDGTADGTFLVKDINPGNAYGYYNSVTGAGVITVINGILYFGANDGAHGIELWRSDGTADGTFLVRDIYSGNYDGYGHAYNHNKGAVINGILYFSAYDGIHGLELWRSDGTADGTFLVRDINPGNYNSGYYGGVGITIVDGVLYFGADDGVHGIELWRSDGTADGTFLVKDINPGNKSGCGYAYSYSKSAVVNGILYFSADDGTHGYELWKLGEGIITQHFHQLSQNSLFQARQQLAKGSDFKICADGSQASIYKVSGGDQDYSKAVIKILDDDVSQTGSLSIVHQSRDSLIVCHKHPDYVKTSGSSTTLVAGVYTTPNSTALITMFNIIVYRAPVLMVHGLWSNNSTYSDLEKALISAQLYPATPKLTQAFNYSATASWEFASNYPRISTAINSLIISLRAANVSAGKVDYIGHSMGGILGRLHLQSIDYKDDIHKLITVNTPHYGSQFANLLRSPDHPKKNLVACDVINRTLGPFIGGACDGGAVDNLRVDSQAILTDLNGLGNINRNTVPSHSIATTELIDVDGSLSKRKKTAGIFLIAHSYNTDLNTLFQAANDVIVSTISQRGGLQGDCTTLLNNQWHVGSVSNARVMSQIQNLLLSPTSVSFCTSGFAAKTLTPPNIPRTNSQLTNVANSANNTETIQIVSPTPDSYVTSGKSLTINIVGSNLIEISTMVDYNADSIYAALTSGNQTMFTLIADGRFTGKKQIIVIGKTVSGDLVTDTTHFYVSNTVISGTCNSLQSGEWTSSATWSCGHEPLVTDVVTINSGHIIIVSTNAAQANRIIFKNGTIRFTASGTKVFLREPD